MKIDNLKINNFGNLNSKDISLKKLNIIFGKNESGKSTLLNFVINILYNISKNKNGKNISDYDKYFPWNENDFSGKIIYELDNKNKYEVFRNFNKKNPEIYDENGNDISNKFNIDKKIGNLFIIEQLKIDKETLMSTVVASQNETKIDGEKQNLLIQKVSNLVESGDEDISYKKAINTLDKLLLTEVGTDKSQDRPINIAKKNIIKYKNELDEIKNYEKLKYEIEEKNKKKKNEKKKEENNKIIYEKIKKILNNDKLEQEQIDIKKKILKENLNKINKLISQEDLNNKNKKNKLSYILLITSILINIASFIFIKNKIINVLLLFLIPLAILLIILRNKKYNTKNIRLQIETIENNNKELNDEISEAERKLNETNLKEKNNLIKIYGKEIENLFNYKLIEDISIKNKENIEKLNLEIHKLKLDLENIEPKMEKISELEELLYIENENLEKLENKSEIFNKTKELIESSYQEMKNNVTPKFNKNLSENIKKISNGKYKKIILNNGISVELDNGQYVSIDRLSTGTIEQIYLSLRLSVINEISEESLPILLDETFAYYDDERLKSTLEFLSKINNQILIFTCTNREKDILDKLHIEYNLIEL